jgi:hypothetical protein
MPVAVGQGFEGTVIYPSTGLRRASGGPAFQRLNVAPGGELEMLSLLRVAADFGRC